VRQVPTADSLNPGLLLRLARNRYYLAGLVLLVLGLGLSLVALRSLPLFVVQPVRASGLAVTAALSVLVLHEKLRSMELVALATVLGGLVLLGLSSTGSDGTQSDAATGIWVLIAVAVIVGVALVGLPILRDRGPGIFLAVLAGLSFSLVAVSARCIDSLAPARILTSLSAWAMGIAGITALLLGAMALQRTSVVTATGWLVVTETLVAAVIGIVAFGDRPAHGGIAIASVGFALALIGSLALARFGAPAERAEAADQPDSAAR
jgi:drug/metabolite transporter (DMT)-like permease